MVEVKSLIEEEKKEKTDRQSVTEGEARGQGTDTKKMNHHIH